MKTFFAFFAFFVFLAFPATAQSKFTPYYQFRFGEGMSVPSKGDFFANQELATKVGTLWNATDRIKVFGLYDLTYEGPGLMRQEGRLFTERAIRHSMLLEPSFTINDSIGTIKTKVFTIDEKRRSGTNELWGQGLYDYEAVGFSVGINREVFGWRLEPTVRYITMEFPNYTDLLRDFQTSGLTAELSGGLMDQDITGIGLDARYGTVGLYADWSEQKYDREKVVESNGTYGSEKQKDSQTELGGTLDATLWRFTWVPKIGYKMKRSNQNYLRFAFFGDTSPVFVPKNYDYNETNLGSTLFMRLSTKKSIFGSIDIYDRKYTDRPARDRNGAYSGGKQHSVLGSWGGGLRWKVSDYSNWDLAYNFVFSRSNMKFEQFIPYNYTGHVVGLYFTVQP